MIFNLIWGSVAIVFLITIYYQSKCITNGNKNILIGVTIPYLELKNEKVLSILKEFKKENFIIMVIDLILFIPSFFIIMNSIQTIYLFLWIFIVLYLSRRLFIKYNKKLMDMKRENQWLLPSKYLVTIDTEVTRVKNKMPVSILWFIPSIIISLIPIAIIFKRINIYGYLGISACNALIANIIFIIMYKIYSKGKSEVISEDSKINIAYNTIFKRNWTAGTVIAAMIQSISMLFMFLLLINSSNSEILFILAIVVPVILIIGGIFFINNKINKEQSEILKNCEKVIYTDNDEYWSKGVYNNPNDGTVSVPDRTGYGMTYNLGTKKGRLIYYGNLTFAGILLLGLTSMMMVFDFSTFTLKVDNNTIVINAPIYGTKVKTSNIESISMENGIPSGIRTNGVGASTYNLGNFSINGYGKCKLYVYFENQEYICIKLKDNSYIFFNSKSVEETNKYYNELLQEIE